MKPLRIGALTLWVPRPNGMRGGAKCVAGNMETMISCEFFSPFYWHIIWFYVCFCGSLCLSVSLFLFWWLLLSLLLVAILSRPSASPPFLLSLSLFPRWALSRRKARLWLMRLLRTLVLSLSHHLPRKRSWRPRRSPHQHDLCHPCRESSLRRTAKWC